jgi:hypothetical protein
MTEGVSPVKNEKVLVKFSVHGIDIKIKLSKPIAEYFQRREILTVAFERGAFAHLVKKEHPFVDMIELAKRYGCCLLDARAPELAACLPEKFHFCSNAACAHAEFFDKPSWGLVSITQDSYVLNILLPYCGEPKCLDATLTQTEPLVLYGSVYKHIRTLACRHCGVLETEKQVMRACARCKTEHYCGDDCQRAAWPVHKVVCKPVE